MELVFLHGPAASGKLTTARALEALVGYPVFHHHLGVDALTTVFPFGSEAFVGLREQFWLQIFADAARAHRVGAESRQEFQKLTDLETLRRLRAGQDRAEQPPVDAELDTDTSTAEETAADIVSRFALKAEARTDRYADQGTGDRWQEGRRLRMT